MRFRRAKVTSHSLAALDFGSEPQLNVKFTAQHGLCVALFQIYRAPCEFRDHNLPLTRRMLCR